MQVTIHHVLLFATKLSLSPSGRVDSMRAISKIDPAQLLMRVQSEPQRFHLTPDGNLTLIDAMQNQRQRLKECIAFLDELLRG